MDEGRQLSSLERRRDGSPARALSDQRDQVKRYFAELADSADAAEREIAESIRQMLADVAADRDSAQSKRDSAQAAKLAERARQLDAREREIDGLRAELEARETAAAESLRQKARYDERLRRLEEREEELENERQRTKAQRRRLAAEMKDQREAGRREARRAVEDSESTREELRRRHEELQRRAAELDRREADLASSAAAVEGDSQLRGRLRSLEASLAERNAALTEVASEVDDLRSRLNDYKSKLSETEARLVAAQSEANDSDADADLRRLYDEALENVRDLKIRCAALEKAQAAGSPAAATVDEPMDWESQKRRMLATLEAADPRDSAARADRLTIEGTIRITDNVVAEKDREIADLNRRLEEQAGASSSDVKAVVDQDELIARHRAEAERFRNEWSEKLRSAEIELSLERAKLARERTELDERRAEFEAQLARSAKDVYAATSAPGETPRKTGGGRWLARLGLREKDDE